MCRFSANILKHVFFLIHCCLCLKTLILLYLNETLYKSLYVVKNLDLSFKLTPRIKVTRGRLFMQWIGIKHFFTPHNLVENPFRNSLGKDYLVNYRRVELKWIDKGPVECTVSTAESHQGFSLASFFHGSMLPVLMTVRKQVKVQQYCWNKLGHAGPRAEITSKHSGDRRICMALTLRI